MLQVEKDGAACGGCAWVYLTQELFLGERPSECLSSLKSRVMLQRSFQNVEFSRCFTCALGSKFTELVGVAFEETASVVAVLFLLRLRRIAKQNHKADDVEFMIHDLL